MVKRRLEVPSRITVVREEHFVSPKARPSFSLLSPDFHTDSLRFPREPNLSLAQRQCLSGGVSVWRIACGRSRTSVVLRHASDQTLYCATRRQRRGRSAAARLGQAEEERVSEGQQQRLEKLVGRRLSRISRKEGQS